MASPVISNLVPAENALNVLSSSHIEFDLTDADTDLDPSKTKVYVNDLIVWSEGSPVNGWAGATAVIVNGLSYDFTPPVDYVTPVVEVRVVAEDLAANVLDVTYKFFPSIDVVLKIIPYAKRVVRALFNVPIAITPAVLAKSNYSIYLFGTTVEEVEVQDVRYDPNSSLLDYVDLYLSSTNSEQRYQIEVENLVLYTGSLAKSVVGKFVAYTTKVDAMLSSYSQMYDTSTKSNLRQLVTAVANSDEEIGGRREIILPPGVTF